MTAELLYIYRTDPALLTPAQRDEATEAHVAELMAEVRKLNHLPPLASQAELDAEACPAWWPWRGMTEGARLMRMCAVVGVAVVTGSLIWEAADAMTTAIVAAQLGVE